MRAKDLCRAYFAILLLPNLVALSQSDPTISPAAAAYLNAAIDVMQQHSLHKKKLDWPLLRGAALKNAAGAQSPEGTYSSIRLALKMLGDHHSFLQLSPELQAREAKVVPKSSSMPESHSDEASPPSPFVDRRKPAGRIVTINGVRVAHLEVPLFEAADDGKTHEYAEALQHIVAQLAGEKPAGWIIDLRGNLGGNMWPMLTGLSPLLQGGGPLGSFVDDEERREIWIASAHGVGVDGHDGKRQILCWTPAQLVSFARPAIIAVLVDRGTASSGEAVAIALQGRPLSRSFGRHTHGQSTSNDGFPLADGANLVLTTAVEADRTGKLYLDGIQPDVELPEQKVLPRSDEDDLAVQTASTWIKTQSGQR